MKALYTSTLVAGVALCALSAPATAAVPVTCGSSSAVFTSLTPVADPSCAGYYANGIEGNQGTIFSNSDSDVALQQAALAFLGYAGPAIDFDMLYASGSTYLQDALGVGDTLSFTGHELYGTVFIGIHWGKGQSEYKGGPSAIYKLNITDPLSSIAITTPAGFGGFSSATLYYTDTPVVPEPASWALLIAGFGAVGFAMRRRRTAVAFA